MGDPKTVLHHYLQATRDDLIWKLDGLGERDARLPRTATGNNLLGVVKHCLNIEAGYFGPTFGREFPTPEELVPEEAYQQDPRLAETTSTAALATPRQLHVTGLHTAQSQAHPHV